MREINIMREGAPAIKMKHTRDFSIVGWSYIDSINAW